MIKNLKFSIFSAAVLLSIFLLSSSSVVAQQRQTLERLVQPNEPVQIVGMRVNGQDVNFSNGFSDNGLAYVSGGEDWLKDFTVSLHNTSGRNISYASVMVSVETRPGHIVAVEAEYGREPRPGEAVSSRIANGETAGFTHTDEMYTFFREQLALQGVFTINRAKVRIYKIIFDDDTMWTSSLFYRRDLNQPENWSIIESNGNDISFQSTPFQPYSFHLRNLQINRWGDGGCWQSPNPASIDCGAGISCSQPAQCRASGQSSQPWFQGSKFGREQRTVECTTPASCSDCTNSTTQVNIYTSNPNCDTAEW